MKRITAMALFTLAGLLGMGNASAQNHEVRATVPFNFMAGSKQLPAGNYSIVSVSDGTIEIRNRAGHVAILTEAVAGTAQAKNDGKLVFNRHNDRYFLREIRCESAAMNLRLPVTKLEKRESVEEAKVASRGGEVLIALK